MCVWGVMISMTWFVGDTNHRGAILLGACKGPCSQSNHLAGSPAKCCSKSCSSIATHRATSHGSCVASCGTRSLVSSGPLSPPSGMQTLPWLGGIRRPRGRRGTPGIRGEVRTPLPWDHSQGGMGPRLTLHKDLQRGFGHPAPVGRQIRVGALAS